MEEQKQLCYKCGVKPPNYKIRSQKVCRDCFIKNTEHLFRSNLKALLSPKKGENLLIAISGGANSMSMLHLTDTCKNPEKTTKLMQFTPVLLYIDDSFIYHTPQSQVSEFLESVEKRYNVHINVIKIEEKIPDIEEQLNLPSQAKSDMLYFVINNLITDFARENNYQKVITGESASRVSTLVMSEICKGRGVSVSSFSSPILLVDGITIARPLRELLEKEVAIYHSIYDVPLLTKLPMAQSLTLPWAGSMDILIQDFLGNLQSKFPSTTHTLLRTATKLIPQGNFNEICAICKHTKDGPINHLEKFNSEYEDICYACHHLRQNK
ncbi:unnamed protein product [Blepharisma stoltei]|uniref:Cytoplasmic tRNA 2-thiolation protein 2 n=1 Tax=Blepharisma stoltei TaxID=1481888 RepID=A0AAU9KAP1_9CILI|nr:unnamed protein product [Blepharisma stoltei]